MDIKETIKNLPNSPGVYLMKDENGDTLYVGKAGNLRKRVSSYFQKARHLRERLELLVSRVRDITFITTSTEAEALIYENSLIKQLAPKYNVALRDDKSYPLFKLAINEKFPRLFITRIKKDDGALYFGPYPDAGLLRESLKILKRIFPLRNCNKMPKKLCLEYHISQCLGPCVGKIDEAGYKNIVTELKLFLQGNIKELLVFLSDRMTEASRREDYEEAARLRNTLEALSAIKERTINYNPRDEADELKNILGIHGNLERIEAFDVSNIMGKEACGSMIYFYKGRPKKSEYRRFKIKTVSKIDDYGMIRELVRRRYSRLLNEKADLPDLILIDGGRGHLNVASDELKNLRLSEIPVIGIAKPAHLQGKPMSAGGEFEHIYLKDRKEPLILPKESKALHLLEKIRDEAHRFAISYHKMLLSKKIEMSELDNIKGIGKKRKRSLINHFGSVDAIKKVADYNELMKVDGIDEKTAQNIVDYFKK